MAINDRPYGVDEIGSLGLEAWSGFVQQAYDSQLFWPQSGKVFDRIRRSDPEVAGIIRPTFSALARGVRFDWQTPDQPSDDDKRAAEYGAEILDDLDGGISALAETIASYVPFMGWGWWEELWGVRSSTWRPPDPDDDWKSSYNDGLPTIRRLAWRDHSSFARWDLNEKTGRLFGLVQTDFPNPEVTIPLTRSLHLTFGDPINPEGLSPLEALWRLERIKYGLETIMGIGFEHSAGYSRFQPKNALAPEDRAAIREAARTMMTPQRGSFVALPGHISAEIMDGQFSSGPSLLEAIRYYGLLKLQMFTMQWVAMATTASAGALATHSDSSEMAIMVYNAMWDGFADQMDTQIGKRIFSHPQVRAAFPGMTRRPRLIAVPVEKSIPLTLLSQFVSQIAPVVPMDDDDLIAIRRKSGFLPETLPTPEEPVVEPTEETISGEIEEGEEESTEEGEIDTTDERASMMYGAMTELLLELRGSLR